MPGPSFASVKRNGREESRPRVCKRSVVRARSLLATLWARLLEVPRLWHPRQRSLSEARSLPASTVLTQCTVVFDRAVLVGERSRKYKVETLVACESKCQEPDGHCDNPAHNATSGGSKAELWLTRRDRVTTSSVRERSFVAGAAEGFRARACPAIALPVRHALMGGDAAAAHVWPKRASVTGATTNVMAIRPFVLAPLEACVL